MGWGWDERVEKRTKGSGCWCGGGGGNPRAGLRVVGGATDVLLGHWYSQLEKGVSGGGFASNGGGSSALTHDLLVGCNGEGCVVEE